MTALVLDIGSSSVRALLFDGDHQPIPGAITRREHAFTTSVEGAATADATALRQQTEAVIDELLAAHPYVHIERVGACTFVGNLLGVDVNNKPTTPLYTYADNRAGECLARYRPHADAILQRTGARLHSAYNTAKLMWLQDEYPDVFARTHQWTDIATHIYRTWFGRDDMPCSYSVASWGGLLNRERLTWDTAWLDALGIQPGQLPPLADYDAVQHGLTSAYRQRWPQLANTPFYLAVGDGAAANVGSGAVYEGTVALTVGTTAAVRVISTEMPTVPAGLWSYRLTANHHLTGGATTEGGGVYAWLTNTLRLEPQDTEALLANHQPGKHGLTVLPLLGGERSPGWGHNATGTLHGLTFATTAEDILTASLEAVALRVAAVAADIAPANAIIYGGGGALAASRGWAQMFADALGRPLALLAETEVTARGVAILITNGPEAPPPRVSLTLTPNPTKTAIYRRLQAEQNALYRRLYSSD